MTLTLPTDHTLLSRALDGGTLRTPPTTPTIRSGDVTFRIEDGRLVTVPDAAFDLTGLRAAPPRRLEDHTEAPTAYASVALRGTEDRVQLCTSQRAASSPTDGDPFERTVLQLTRIETPDDTTYRLVVQAAGPQGPAHRLRPGTYVARWPGPRRDSRPAITDLLIRATAGQTGDDVLDEDERDARAITLEASGTLVSIADDIAAHEALTPVLELIQVQAGL